MDRLHESIKDTQGTCKGTAYDIIFIGQTLYKLCVIEDTFNIFEPL